MFFCFKYPLKAEHLFCFLLLWCCAVPDTFGQWQSLFAEGDLSGFRRLGGEAEFSMESGVLTGISHPNTPNSFLATQKRYADFILEVEVKIENDLNSGIQFRSNTDPDQHHRVFGYQAEIETSERRWAGGIYDESRRGWLYPLTRNPKGQTAFRNGGWNHYRIEAVGNQIRTYVNHIPCANLVDDWTAEGFIAFQVHSIGKPELAGKKVRWRKARILESPPSDSLWQLPLPPEISYLDNQLTEQERRKGWRLLWDGETTSGWQSVSSPEFPDTGWHIKGEHLVVTGQRGGDIVTKEHFGNFELAVDFRWTPKANSGIKYLVNPRWLAEKGEAIGLEFQILDDKKHPDANQGTAGNRQLAALYDLIPPENMSEPNRTTRRINAPPRFNRARIVVYDGKVEHWLNEIKVVSYDRYSQVFQTLIRHSKYHQYEQFGQLPAGPIVLQDHGDEVHFKNIKIREF